MTPSDLTERIADAYAGSTDVELLTAARDPSTDAAKATLAIRTAAAVPVSLASVPGLEEIAAIEARLSPQTEGVVSALNYAGDFGEVARAAAILSVQNREREAECLHRQLIRLRSVAFGPESRESADAIVGLAKCYYEQAKFEEAKLAFEHAVEIRERVLGDSHAETGFALFGLGMTLEGFVQYEKAATCHQRALIIFDSQFGEENPVTCECCCHLGCVYFAMNDSHKALDLFSRAERLAEAIYGKNDSRTIRHKLNYRFEMFLPTERGILKNHVRQPARIDGVENESPWIPGDEWKRPDNEIILTYRDIAIKPAEEDLSSLESQLAPNDANISWARLILGLFYSSEGHLLVTALDCFQRALSTEKSDKYSDVLMAMTLELNIKWVRRRLSGFEAMETRGTTQLIAEKHFASSSPVILRLEKTISEINTRWYNYARFCFDGRVFAVPVVK